ncbi:Zn-dependent hydrolase [Herbidospora mongoliensis]|uniref:Zn-dependent hydrolase n=1 Tax=Herbidospora mongoliensis TaxID=688067 RepID=UPI001C3F25D1|nr:Zn-dependent hydrolase [Herbidospora mongoliensis]
MTTPSLDTQATRVTVRGDRLLADITRLAAIGGRLDGGVDRVAGSAADLAARDWLGARIAEAGCVTWRDPTGNIFGRAPGGRDPWLLAGSHTDTVPGGGRLDGAYGVLAALETLRALHESGHPAARCLEIVSFWDEEGAAPTSTGGLTGSTAFCASDHVKRVAAFLEPHIEQGPRMEAAGFDLAVVDGIVGIDRHTVVVTGETNHAGTTPTDRRADAGRAAARILIAVRDVAAEADPSMVANVGCVEVLPGAPNVVPGEARLVVEFRAATRAALDLAAARLAARAEEAAREERCTAAVTPLSSKPESRFDPALRDLLGRTCADLGVPTTSMVSFAGHDAGVLSRHVPTAMLFVPSTGGVSHAPAEHTPDRQLVLGCQALLDTVVAWYQTRGERQ